MFHEVKYCEKHKWMGIEFQPSILPAYVNLKVKMGWFAAYSVSKKSSWPIQQRIVCLKTTIREHCDYLNADKIGNNHDSI